MSDDKNLRDQFHILFDDFDDFEKTAEETAETAAEAAETVTETVGTTAEAVKSAAETVESAAETVESTAETAVETAADHIENAADTADSTVRQAAGLVDDTDIRNEKIYNEINFEDLSNVIGEQGEDEPAAITDAVKQATQTAVEAHSEIDHTFSDDLEDFDGMDELDDDFAALSKSLEESFEDSDVSAEMIPAIETASTAAVLSQDEDTDLVFEELSDEDDDEDDDDDDEDDDEDDDDDDDDEDDDEFDDEEDIIPIRRRNRNTEPTADDLKKESRNFWIFTAVVALLVAAAILFILWKRGIIFSDPTETPAPSTTAAVSTEESTTLPVTSTEEPTTEEVTTEEPTTEEITTEEPTEDPAEEVVLHYSNIFVVKADEANSLYVRDAGSPEGKVIGILYGFSGGEILGEEGDWYHVSSGSVTGYVSKNFVQTGDAAKELAKAHTALHAKVTADTLNVRSAPDTSDDGNIINTVLKGASLPYLATEGNFYKITDPNGNVGYVSTAFSDLGYYLDEAVPYTQP